MNCARCGEWLTHSDPDISPYCSPQCVYSAMMVERDQAQAEARRLRDALKILADPANYQYTGTWPAIMVTVSDIAKAALAEQPS